MRTVRPPIFSRATRTCSERVDLPDPDRPVKKSVNPSRVRSMDSELYHRAAGRSIPTFGGRLQRRADHLALAPCIDMTVRERGRRPDDLPAAERIGRLDEE